MFSEANAKLRERKLSMDYTCKNTIIQNMKDFGCDEETINAFMDCMDRNDCLGKKRILDDYRRKLIEELHQSQKNIDLFDYMIYQMDKCKCE